MSDARICSECGGQNSPSANFCRDCGVRVEFAVEPVSGEPALAEADAPPPTFNPRLFRELCWLCGLPLLISIAGTVSFRADGPTALVEMFAVGGMALIAGGAAFANAGLVRSSLRLPAARHLLLTVLVGVILMPTLVAAFWGLHRLGFTFEDDYVSSYLNDGWPVWVAYVAVALVTPVAEEVLFRGVLQPKLAQVLTTTEVLIVQAALFAALHLSPVILLTHFVMGFAFGWLRLRSNSLIPGMLLHGAWNAGVLWSAPV